jgi:protein-arginine deiminase
MLAAQLLWPSRVESGQRGSRTIKDKPMRANLCRLLVTGVLVVTPILGLSWLVHGGTGTKAPAFRADRQGPNGAVLLLFNCDASDMPRDGQDHFDRYDPDYFDQVINGADDRKQVEPFFLVQTTRRSPLTLKLVNFAPTTKDSPSKFVRIFNAKESEILGPRTGDSYTLSPAEQELLARGDLPLFAEGLQFGATVRLRLLSGDGTEPQDELVLHVAPFLLTPHTHDPLHNMVVRLPGSAVSAQYVQSFERACLGARKQSPPARALNVKVLNVRHNDRWIQDEMEWGYTETPRYRLPVVLHTPRQRELARDVQGLLAPDIGYFQPFRAPVANGGSLDYGGNLEVTPPTKQYPLGRIYYGGRPSMLDRKNPHPAVQRHMSVCMKNFFKQQKRFPTDKQAVQEPIELTTDWLGVGHVDEIVSFVPANTKTGFVLLWASPELALNLLTDLPFEMRTDPNYLDAGRQRYKFYGAATPDDLLELDLRKLTNPEVNFLPGESLRSYNLKVEAKIRQAVETFKTELDLSEDDIIAIPVLFCNADPTRWASEALTPGMVNLSSLGNVSLIPDPLIPRFREYVRDTLGKIGQTPIFIDDWETYHILKGEVHCGSNTQRLPNHRKWWQ